jgi:hypothetical protein
MAVFGLLSLQVLVPRQFAHICHNINMEWGVKENHVAVISLHKFSNFLILKTIENFLNDCLLGN